MAIIDDFVSLNKACKKLFPKVFDNNSMTPNNVSPKKMVMCLKCNGSRVITVQSAAKGKWQVECDVCKGLGAVLV